MAYERYGRDDGQRTTNDWDRQDYGASSARDYRSAGDLGGYGRDNERGYGHRDDGRQGYGQRDYGNQRYGQNERVGRDDPSTRGFDDRQGFTGTDYYRGDTGRREAGDQGRDTYRQSRGTFDRQPQSYGRDNDRGFFERAGDEVRSWFGDEDAERRREQDARADRERDAHYRSWRDQQVAAFDRDYDEYRRENQTKFHNEFSSFRTDRQGQRDLLDKVTEHQEVVGSDGAHVGTVDKVRGDRIILTKSDQDAGGRHHSIPSRWLQSADDGKLTLRKTADEAKQHWRDEERQGALFGNDQTRSTDGGDRTTGGTLSRSFSGNY